MKFFPKYRNEFLISVCAVIAYALCIINDFHTDDWIVLRIMKDGFSWHSLLSMDNPRYFRPLTNVIIYLRYLVFGANPAGYYLLNILFHVVACTLLYRFLLKIGFQSAVALVSSLTFAVYFQHYEAVLWLYGFSRALAAIFWLASLSVLSDFLGTGRKSLFVWFLVLMSLGLLSAEDFSVAPTVFAAFAFLMSENANTNRRTWTAILGSVVVLAVYLVIRFLLIARPSITEDYYSVGFHIVRNLLNYLGWMIIPSPEHAYFQVFARRLGPIIYTIWRVASILALGGFVVTLIYAFIRSSKRIRFFILFLLITLAPTLPFVFKVGSRYVYAPSIGLAALAGVLVSRVMRRMQNWPFLRPLFLTGLIIYFVINVLAIGITSTQYRRNQTLVADMTADLAGSKIDFNQYRYVLLDHVPGRAIVGSAMVYKFAYKYDVISSNDPVAGPINIRSAVKELTKGNATFIVFDYRDGHLRDATAEYVSSD